MHPLVLDASGTAAFEIVAPAAVRTPRSTAAPGVVSHYAASWLRPVENHLLAVPREVVRTLPERLQELLGYNIYPPFFGYVDGRHPRRLLNRG